MTLTIVVLCFSETGKFLALDLGGTNFRVLLIELSGEHFEMKSKIFAIPEHIMLGSGEQLFDHIAECLAIFVKEEQVSLSKTKLQRGTASIFWGSFSRSFGHRVFETILRKLFKYSLKGACPSNLFQNCKYFRKNGGFREAPMDRSIFLSCPFTRKPQGVGTSRQSTSF